MKILVLCLLLAVLSFAATDSLLVQAPLPDSIVQKLKSEDHQWIHKEMSKKFYHYYLNEREGSKEYKEQIVEKYGENWVWHKDWWMEY